MEQKQNLIITPKTKVLELIETYPELEDVLIEYAPAFKNLKNPVLRRTVAKIATLQQAAAIGGVKTEELINRLRKEIGQDLASENMDIQYNYRKPDWYAEEKIVKRFNASEMLAAGEHPVNQVIFKRGDWQAALDLHDRAGQAAGERTLDIDRPGRSCGRSGGLAGQNQVRAVQHIGRADRQRWTAARVAGAVDHRLHDDPAIHNLDCRDEGAIIDQSRT